MAAIDHLKHQHRETEDLFERIKQATTNEKVRLLGELTEALTLHAALEERYFYPLARENGLAAEMDHSQREHAEVRRMLSDIMSMKKSDPRLNETISRLEASVKKHVHEEENEIFPRVLEKVGSEELDRVDQQMREAEQSLKDKELLEAADEDQVPAP